MQAIFQVTVPFFALVWLGYMAARTGRLPLDAVPGLNAFVLFFALPCMLFRFGAQLPLRELLDPVVLSIWLLCALLVVFITVALTLSRRVVMKDAAFGALVAAFPNSGFMGVPMLTAIAGPAAAGPLLTGLLCDIFVTSSVCIALARSREEQSTLPAIGPGHGDHPDTHLSADYGAAIHADYAADFPGEYLDPRDEPALVGYPASPGLAGGARGSMAGVALRLMRATLGNPLPWAIALGATAHALGLELPGPLDRVIALLADAATPVALFTIGAVLWRARVHALELQEAHLSPADDPPPDPEKLARSRFAIARHAAALGRQGSWAQLRPDLAVVVIKLLVHPALVFVVALAAKALGAPLSSFQLTVLVLAAALPSASNVAVLAERYRADSGRIARIVMGTTAFSFLSFSLLAWGLGMQPR
ncbi:MAG: hypothetical protein RL722_2491 [Pseudomonadota bacterium]|jgi:predicted permease